MSGTGPLQKEAEKVAIDIACEDVNEYLTEKGCKKYIQAEIRDSEFDYSKIQNALEEFLMDSIKLVVFSGISSNLVMIEDYVNSNGILLINQTSTAVELSRDDNIYRLVPDDRYLSKVMGNLFKDEGMERIISLFRGDLWGRGLANSIKTAFESTGGSVARVSYDPRYSDVDLENAVKSLDSLVKLSLDDFDSNSVAVSYLMFEEGIKLFELASKYPSLRSVKWFGSDGFAQNQELLTNTNAADFVNSVGGYCPLVAGGKSENTISIKNRIANMIGYDPYSWAVLLYDAYFLAALTRVDEDYGVEIVKKKKALLNVIATYEPVSGTIILNDNGDRENDSYDFWSVMFSDSTYSWVKSFTYPGE